MIATQARGFVYDTTLAGPELEILFGTGEEKRQARLKTVQPGEIDVAAIHHIEGAGFEGKMVEDLDIVHFPGGNVDKTRNVAAQVEQRMEFHRGFASAELRPREQLQTKIDRGGIERIDRLIQLDSKGFLGIEPACLRDQEMGEIGINAPVALLIGLGQGIACDRTAKAQVIKFGFDGVENGFEIAEAVSVG